VVDPPVIVSLASETRPADGAIVTTGPPPRTMVAPAPAPLSITLLRIVKPPSKVPRPTVTASPGRARSSAAWIERTQPGAVPTHGPAPSKARAVT
jgi:hypothetical protein